jgi:hypothetical protein
MTTGQRPDFLGDLESEVRAEMAAADARSPLELFMSPEGGWLVDPAEVQSEQTGLRSLLGAIEVLEMLRATPGAPRPEG